MSLPTPNANCHEVLSENYCRRTIYEGMNKCVPFLLAPSFSILHFRKVFCNVFHQETALSYSKMIPQQLNRIRLDQESQCCRLHREGKPTSQKKTMANPLSLILLNQPRGSCQWNHQAVMLESIPLIVLPSYSFTAISSHFCDSKMAAVPLLCCVMLSLNWFTVFMI